MRGGAHAVPALFELQGFSPVNQEGFELRVGQTAVIRATLSAAVTESITVSTTVPLVDVYRTDTSTNIVPEQIESLPVPDRDFQRLAFIAPGVQRERGGFRFIGGGPVVGEEVELCGSEAGHWIQDIIAEPSAASRRPAVAGALSARSRHPCGTLFSIA